MAMKESRVISTALEFGGDKKLMSGCANILEVFVKEAEGGRLGRIPETIIEERRRAAKRIKAATASVTSSRNARWN
jgi:hypothetical protein